MHIIVKKYEGFNRAMGKYIRSRKHYEEEMKKGGYTPYEEVSPKRMQWVPSADLKKTLGEVYQQKEVGGRLISKMKDMGVKFNPKFMPKDLKGGLE